MSYGYWVGYSYRGRMADGSWREFVSEKEYLEALLSEEEETE